MVCAPQARGCFIIFTIYESRFTVFRALSFVRCTDSFHNILTRALLELIILLMSLASIQNEIKKLEPAERAALIDVLWESLDEERIKEIEAKWAVESEDRIDAFERGELSAVDGPSELEKVRSSLKK